MDEIFEDVAKVQKLVEDTLGPQKSFNLDRIFNKLEHFIHEPSSSRIEKVARSLVAEIKPETENVDQLPDKSISSNNHSHTIINENGQTQIIVEDDIENHNDNDKDKSCLVLKVNSDSHRSTPSSVISITTDEER